MKRYETEETITRLVHNSVVRIIFFYPTNMPMPAVSNHEVLFSRTCSLDILHFAIRLLYTCLKPLAVITAYQTEYYRSVL